MNIASKYTKVDLHKNTLSDGPSIKCEINVIKLHLSRSAFKSHFFIPIIASMALSNYKHIYKQIFKLPHWTLKG